MINILIDETELIKNLNNNSDSHQRINDLIVSLQNELLITNNKVYNLTEQIEKLSQHIIQLQQKEIVDHQSFFTKLINVLTRKDTKEVMNNFKETTIVL